MGVIVQPDKKVTDSFAVKCYEVDSAKRLKPSAFMDMAQEMAYQAASAMKFGYYELCFVLEDILGLSYLKRIH